VSLSITDFLSSATGLAFTSFLSIGYRFPQPQAHREQVTQSFTDGD
jgi:hypothetical protein